MSYPATISISWSSAVSIIICTLLIFLISSQKSNPLPSGSPTSEIIKSTLLFSKTSLASFMLKAVHTLYPSFFSLKLIPLFRDLSSSKSNIFPII